MSSNELFNKSRDASSDIWDDTALIKMYEDSINISLPKDDTSQAWKAGDKCTAPYPDDGLWYRATIIRIAGPKAYVVYEGYEDDSEAAVDVSELAEYAEGEEEESTTENGAVPAPATAPAQNQAQIVESAMRNTFSTNPTHFLPPFAPPPPPIFNNLAQPDQVEALSSMLMSWYMSGYHTGCYVTMQQMHKQNGK